MPSITRSTACRRTRTAGCSKQILRKEMGFKGAVVSDYWGIDDLQRLHFSGAGSHARRRSRTEPGVDFDLPDGNAFAKLPEALAKGLVTQADIDQAVRRMLRLKLLSGVFEQPYADVKYAQEITDNAEARALAPKEERRVRRAAQERRHATHYARIALKTPRRNWPERGGCPARWLFEHPAAHRQHPGRHPRKARHEGKVVTAERRAHHRQGRLE